MPPQATAHDVIAVAGRPAGLDDAGLVGATLDNTRQPDACVVQSAAASI
ncbi:hypothetical protein [uncultured Maricaulis sp.]